MCVQVSAELVGNNIKYIREMNDETQEELADVVFVSSKAISNYEQGIRLPKGDILSKIADHYKLSVDTLLSDNIQKIFWKSDNKYLDIDKLVMFFKKLFPLYIDSINCGGYKCAINHCNIYLDNVSEGEILLDELRFAEQVLDRINSEDINIVEGIAACRLWIILVLCNLMVNIDNDNFDIDIDIEEENIKYKDLLKLKNEISDDLLEDIEEVKDIFYEQIKILKNSSKKSLRDLAEHYIAAGHLVRLLSPELSVADARNVGLQILASQHLADNCYSTDALIAYYEFHNIEIPQTV